MSVQEIIEAIRRLPPQERQRVIDAASDDAEAMTGVDGARRESFHDRAKHLIGPPSGVRDLGSNPKHMEGFGRDALS